MAKELILSVATRGTASPNWRDPNDRSRFFTNSIEPWLELAKLAEKGKLNSVFIVDHLGWFDVYGDDHEAAAKAGINAVRISPTEAVTAMGLVTKNIGFGITASTISEHPYHFARRLATLDHLTKGRVGWNIVTSFLPSAGRNFTFDGILPEHDKRYEKTTEYLDIVYDLLLSSWRDNALIRDKEQGIFADPDAIRKINHEGKYYKVEGPAITEPTIQRFPLIIQAGTSTKGKLLAAENAELIFITLDENTRINILEVKRLAQEKFGRDPDNLKFIIPANVILGQSHEDAVRKFELYKALQSEELGLIYFSAGSGVDVSKYGWDEPIGIDGESNGTSSSIKGLKNSDGSYKTKRDLVARQLNESTRFIGTVKEVADLIEETVEETGIDGFNFQVNTFPDCVKDIVELLVPELRKRGLAQKDYKVPGGTFRENFYGTKGQTFVTKDHPAYGLRWQKGTQAEFERELLGLKSQRDRKREPLV